MVAFCVLAAPNAWSQKVAVLDVTMEEDGEIDNWALGLADFLELELQNRGLPVYARRDLHYVLDERRLTWSGLGKCRSTLIKKLPRVDYLVHGTVRKKGDQEFLLRISMAQVNSGREVTTIPKQGAYPADLPGVISACAGRLAGVLSAATDAQATSRQLPLGFTASPEAVCPKLLKRYRQALVVLRFTI